MPTIFFFIGLFIMVAGLVETGVIEAVGMAAVRGWRKLGGANGAGAVARQSRRR